MKNANLNNNKVAKINLNFLKKIIIILDLF